MPNLLYIKGPPGSGKITVARLLQKELEWTLFWAHDLDPLFQNTVGTIGVRSGKLRELLDDVTTSVFRYLLHERRNIIYVRPSRSKETVDKVRGLVDDINLQLIENNLPLYKMCITNLYAKYETLVNRVTEREHIGLRISNKKELDEYLGAREQINSPGETAISTEGCTPEYVAERIKWVLGLKKEPV